MPHNIEVEPLGTDRTKTTYTDADGGDLRVFTYGDDKPLFRAEYYGGVVLSPKQTKHLRKLLKADHRAAR